MSEDKTKGLERTYGRGSGEREYQRIPMPKFRPKPSRLFESNHAAYPQTGAYASEDTRDTHDLDAAVSGIENTSEGPNCDALDY